MLSTSLFRRVVGEGIGTYALVTAGCGAILVDDPAGVTGAYEDRLSAFRLARDALRNRIEGELLTGPGG